jgi:pimeloyl-ACP methyl ester carboxylesterase
MQQQIRFCKTSDGVRLAYASVGSGSPLVKAANWLSHIEYDWRTPIWRPLFERLARNRRLIRYDERGCGLSDWDVQDFSLEAWVRDLETVVDAAGLDRFSLLAISQGGPIAIEYTVRHPERVKRLVLYGTYARGHLKRNPTPMQIKERNVMLELVDVVGDARAQRSDRSFPRSFSPTARPSSCMRSTTCSARRRHPRTRRG